MHYIFKVAYEFTHSFINFQWRHLKATFIHKIFHDVMKYDVIKSERVILHPPAAPANRWKILSGMQEYGVLLEPSHSLRELERDSAMLPVQRHRRTFTIILSLFTIVICRVCSSYIVLSRFAIVQSPTYCRVLSS